VVAVVGNNIVLHSDVLQQTHIIAAGQKVDPRYRPHLFEEIYHSTLKGVIDQLTVLDIAEKDTNLVISDEEVDRALEQQIEDFIYRAGSEENFVEMVGMSMRQVRVEYWKEIRNMMMMERFQYSKIQNIDVSRPEVFEFYSIYSDSIPSIPPQFTYSIIETPFIAGEKSISETVSILDNLKLQIESGTASFDSLASVYSDDPGSAPNGGHLGFTERGTLVQEYEKTAYALTPGEVSNPVKSPFGYHLIRLIEKKGEKISTQHILKQITFSREDKDAALKIIKDIYYKGQSASFLFDSAAVYHAQTHKNLSGKFSNIVPDNIHSLILNQINGLNENELSPPFETENGYALLRLYKKKEAYTPDPNNSWDIIYQYAKQEKQNRVFQLWLDHVKQNTFIKAF
jgi:peptidyl-prolyl cis-trans isomerase SurA